MASIQAKQCTIHLLSKKRLKNSNVIFSRSRKLVESIEGIARLRPSPDSTLMCLNHAHVGMPDKICFSHDVISSLVAIATN